MNTKPALMALTGALLLAAACDRRDPGLRAAGVVEGRIVTVRALTGGRLKEWTASPAAPVSKGDVLGRIDDARLASGREELDLTEREIALAEERSRSQIPALQAKLDFVRSTEEKLERLRKDRAVSAAEIEKVRLERIAAEAALDDVRRSLVAVPIQREKIAAKRRALDAAAAELDLISPVDGVILETRAVAGETLLPGAAAAEILDLSSLRVAVFIEERELAGLRLNDRVTVRADGPAGGPEWPGTIVQFGAEAEFSPRYTISEKERGALLFKVLVRIDEGAAGALKIGMPVTVVFGRPPSR